MTLEVLQSPKDVREKVRGWHRGGASVGLVPTMGALHEGHLSLVRASVAECHRTVASIYVNPTQFAAGEDLDRYPRRLQQDCALLDECGADLVFCPSDEVMYPPGFCTYVVQEGLTETLCGAFRPVHFQGVLTVVLKLLSIVPADRAYFGRKDFQQSVVIRRMAADLNLPVEIRALPTVREPDGLALSSRNQYLSPKQREQAVCLFNALAAARKLYRNGETRLAPLVDAMNDIVGSYPEARAQYVEIVSPDTLQAATEVTDDCVAALAVFVGEVRLIDNMPIGRCADVFVQARKG